LNRFNLLLGPFQLYQHLGQLSSSKELRKSSSWNKVVRVPCWREQLMSPPTIQKTSDSFIFKYKLINKLFRSAFFVGDENVGSDEEEWFGTHYLYQNSLMCKLLLIILVCVVKFFPNWEAQITHSVYLGTKSFVIVNQLSMFSYSIFFTVSFFCTYDVNIYGLMGFTCIPSPQIEKKRQCCNRIRDSKNYF